MGKGVRVAPESTLRVAVEAAMPAMLAAVLAHEDAARRGEVEAGIHDMRVATKRLREVFRVFAPAFEPEAHAKRLARLEGLNDSLGRVRDLDVMRERLGALRSPAARLVRESLGPERDEAHRAFVRILDAFHLDGEPAALGGLAERAGKKSRLGPDAPVTELARLAIARRLEVLGSRLEAVAEAPSERALHELRIASKRMRYALEPFRKLLPEPLRELRARVEELQDELGELHDDDVLRVRVLRATLAARPDAREPYLRLLASLDATRRSRLPTVLATLDRLRGRRGILRYRSYIRRVGSGSRRGPKP
ncbi:MAG: CHAD domain-containing protein [Polyangiales bacterium]